MFREHIESLRRRVGCRTVRAGIPAKSVAISLDLPRSPVQMLYQRWQLRGAGALMTRDRRQHDFEIKLEIVLLHAKGESGRTLSTEYDLPSLSTLANWTSIYRRDATRQTANRSPAIPSEKRERDAAHGERTASR